MIISTNESKILTKHTSCACKCKFNGRKCNSNQKWSNDKRQCECKNSIKYRVCEKNHVWNPSTCGCDTDQGYMKSLIYDSVITCD